ncbi:hypothetical protein [Tabrizicola sp.]|uniref:hypothetical protein n=1 Tax=Tabrizicola sp. TaxID=2005166 RepID=UPI003F3BE221
MRQRSVSAEQSTEAAAVAPAAAEVVAPAPEPVAAEPEPPAPEPVAETGAKDDEVVKAEAEVAEPDESAAEAPTEPVADVQEPEAVAEAPAEPVAEETVAAETVAEETVAAETVAETTISAEPASDTPAAAETASEEPVAEEPPAETVAAAAADAAETVLPDLDDDADDAPLVAAPVAAAAVAAAAAAAAAKEPAAYAVDESVLAILREEAEREAHARKADGKPLETQTDLGLDAAVPAGKKAAAPAKKFEVVSSDDSDTKPSARRTLLPDVEEINSTLRPAEQTEEQGAEAVPVAAEGRSSFRSGFLLVLTIAILGAAVYGSADMLARMIPALAGPLESYVSFINGLRLQVDGLMQSATVAIGGTDG